MTAATVELLSYLSKHIKFTIEVYLSAQINVLPTSILQLLMFLAPSQQQARNTTQK